MYTQIREGLPDAVKAVRLPRFGRRGVSRNVVALGLVSLFTDLSSEMVAAILPLYFVLFLRLSPLEFGLIDGLYQGTSAVVRVASGFAADRWRRHKEVAAAGYGISAISKAVLVLAGAASGWVLGAIVVDRVGKGIRTAPRDALISLSTEREHLGVAFGVHRALDTAGALAGPLAAFALLLAVPDGYDVVFVASLCAAVIGFALLTLFVDGKPGIVARERVPLTAIVELLRAPGVRAVIVAAGALALVTISDAFVYLQLQRRTDMSIGLFPLLFVGTSGVYMLLAVPFGRLADRFGRPALLLGGYALLLPLYATLLFPSGGALGVIAALILLGAHYAATDGVLMAIVAARLGAEARGTGMGLVTTVTSVARLVASLAFGAAWTFASAELAVGIFGAGMVAALVVAAVALRDRSGGRLVAV